jgi:hypothetical protein
MNEMTDDGLSAIWFMDRNESELHTFLGSN